MSTWKRRKERIATDPEFAERIRRQQRESAARRRAKAKEAAERHQRVRDLLGIDEPPGPVVQ